MTQHHVPQSANDFADIVDLADHRPGPATEGVSVSARVTYTVPEVATLLGISRATTYVLLKTGQIPARRVGSRWIIACRRFNTWLDGETSDSGARR